MSTEECLNRINNVNDQILKQDNIDEIDVQR